MNAVGGAPRLDRQQHESRVWPGLLFFIVWSARRSLGRFLRLALSGHLQTPRVRSHPIRFILNIWRGEVHGPVGVAGNSAA